MVKVVRTAVVPWSPAEVWKLLADYASISGWAPNVDHSCLLSAQETGVGAVRRIQTGRMTLVETVQEWTPGVSLGYTITGLPAIIRSVVNTWRLHGSGDETTVSLATDVDAGPRPPQQLIAKLVGRKLAEASDEMLAGLADHLATRENETA